MVEKWKDRIVRFSKKLIKEFANKETLILFGVVVAVMYSPVWLGYLLFFVFGWKWSFAMATAWLAFWAGPFTPFFPVCIAITHFLKKLWDRWRKRPVENTDQKKQEEPEDRKEPEDQEEPEDRKEPEGRKELDNQKGGS